jgi:hypothetical protein
MLLCAAVAAVGALAFIWEFSYLQQKQKEHEVRLLREHEEHETTLANELVTVRIDTARLFLERRDWDAALKSLREADSSEKATNRDTLVPLIEQAEHGQAAALLDEAMTAIGHKDAAVALRRLESYLGHPRATEREQATRLRDEVLRATAEAQAVPFLRQLTDFQLASFDVSGELPIQDNDPVTDKRVRPLFMETLRRHIRPERQRRIAVREAERAEAERVAKEIAARESKVRNTAVYRTLAEYVEGVRTTLRADRTFLDKREKVLEAMFRDLGITDREEKDLYRAKLMSRSEKVQVSEPDLIARRLQAKKDFGKLEGFTDAERATFDTMVDRLVDTVLEEMKRR